MASTRESQRLSLRVGKVSRFKADLNNLSLCSSFGQSAKRSSASEEVEKFCLRISFLLGEYEKKNSTASTSRSSLTSASLEGMEEW